MIPSGTSPNASADATSLIVPSPPQAITSRAPLRDRGLRQLARVAGALGDEDLGGVAVRSTAMRRAAPRARRAAPATDPPEIGLMMTVIDGTG